MKKPALVHALSLGLALSLSTLAACGGSADTTPPPATPASTAAAPGTPPATSATFAITPQNSKIEFTGSKTSTHHDGAFTSFSGTVTTPGAVEQGQINVSIDAGSLVIHDPALGPMVDKLMGHLKSPDFFDVAKFAQATFVSTAVKPGATDGGNYTVTGTLTIHGISKSISFPATIAVTGDKLDATATFTINRKDFGMNLVGQPNDPIKDDVQVRLSVHAAKS
jgi:polyisoprenoid-binding protein YceI